jgi:uncharacterized alpha-E superfamily protein
MTDDLGGKANETESACHNLGRVRAGYTPEGWHTVIRMMQMAGQIDAQRANSAALRITRTLVESSRQTIFGVRPSVRQTAIAYKPGRTLNKMLRKRSALTF